MAKAVPTVLKPPQISSDADLRQELQSKLAEAPIKHAAAILDFYELIQVLHESGTIDLLRAFLSARDPLIGRVSRAMSAPDAVRAVRNLIALAQIAGSVDPKVFESLRDAFTEVAEKNKQPRGKRPGILKILKRADSENSLRALSATSDLLESFGRHLGERDSDTNAS